MKFHYWLKGFLAREVLTASGLLLSSWLGILCIVRQITDVIRKKRETRGQITSLLKQTRETYTLEVA